MECNKKVLIVDDELTIIQLLSYFLRKKGCEIFTAFNGKEACEVLKAGHIDVVITDMRMPEMNGMELLCWIKKECRGIVTALHCGTPSDHEDFFRGVKTPEEIVAGRAAAEFFDVEITKSSNYTVFNAALEALLSSEREIQ